MAERFCLRCDWTGEIEEPACPRCDAPLYRMGRSEPTPAPTDVPPSRPEPPADVTRGASLEGSEREGDRDEAVLPSVGMAERGRWRVIALALTLTAVVAFALTRGGELDPRGRDQARGDPQTQADPALPSLPVNPSPGPPPQCSGDATPPADAEPADAVPAATADYYFQGSLDSSLGIEHGPDLVELEGGSSAFSVDEGTGTTVLRFSGGRGLALAPTTRIIPSPEYTIELLFRLDHLTRFRKLIDFKNGTADDGLYVLDGCLTFYPKEQQAITAIGTDAYVQVVLTRDSTDRVVAYVNGVRQFAFADRGSLAEVNGRKTLRFFVDDVTTTGEHSSGSVAQIRLFDQALTANEVALLACTEFLIADETSPCLQILQ